ncbi:unnamed protein product, partial [Ectocarpus fasciculatus]
CSSHVEGTAIFVSYAFYNKGLEAPRNLRFFLKHGVRKSDIFDIEYGIVVKGPCECMECSDPGRFLEDSRDRMLITIRNESNQGFDFGAHASMLNYLESEKRLTYDYYIFLNCGVVGPIVPSYMPPSWHWASAFVDKMKHRVGLVSTSIVCLPSKDRGGYGPKVEGFAFSLSAKALNVVRTNGTSFRQHPTKIHAILHGEFALTKTVMSHNIGIDCLLLAYQGIDWFKPSEWRCNNNKYPSRETFYHGMSIFPLEVIFHKEWWRRKGSVMLNHTERYIQW